MVLLQNKLNLKVTQKQILTPGLVQMVSVLALNKLELKDMITAEIVENPVLEELELQVPSIEEISQREEKRDRADSAEEPKPEGEKSDPFDEIDFGSFFRDYLDPGHRTHSDIESLERPSFENFLSKPSTLTDHLLWQLGSLSLAPEVHEAAEEIIGNLNEDGYLTATEDELLRTASAAPEEPVAAPEPESIDVFEDGIALPEIEKPALVMPGESAPIAPVQPKIHLVDSAQVPQSTPPFSREALREALTVVQSLDPIGVAARDLRECLLLQLRYHHSQYLKSANGTPNGSGETLVDAIAIVENHLRALQNKQYKDIARGIGRSLEDVNSAFDLIRTLDPKPGARYNQQETRLIEPDCAFIKQGDEWLVLMNEDDLPQLRLNPTYKKLMIKDAAEKDVRNYVKERYKSALQLIKNIEQRKQTILRVCHSIIERQHDFLERGIDQLKPMMIKEVAEEIGVHPSTVSRAVANKYVHTPQGVFELRYFFSESVNGPEGGGTSLLILKRRVKKLIEEEDPARPLTDEQITRILQSQGIQVTRRTVAKYREDMKIPSTHQRRVKP
jgi:RNA polymerase sigma-54 factor